MNDVLSAVEQLLQRKADLLDEIKSIDDQIDRVKVALTGGTPIPAKRNYTRPREIRPDGSMPNLIMAALAAKEPRTVEDIANYTEKTKAHIAIALTPMVRQGRIFRVQLNAAGRPYIYARSEAVLRAFNDAPAPAANPSPEDDDELGQGVVSPEEADVVTTTSEVDGSL